MDAPRPPRGGIAATVLVAGESLIDIVVDAQGRTSEHVGGSPANVALGLAALAHPTSLATTLGSDAHGTQCREHLLSHGVDVRAAAGTDPTSTALARLDATGAAAYEFSLHWAPGPIATGGFGHIHTGSIAATLAPGAADVLAAVAAARPHATVSYDPNIRPSIMGEPEPLRAQIEEIVAMSDVVKASEDDLDILYAGQSPEQVMARWAELGCALSVITLGAAGVRWRVPATGAAVTAAALRDEVVDTVGAGDSFMAGLLSGLLDLGLLGGPNARGALRTAAATDVSPAVDRALATSAVTVGQAGAYAPSRDEIAALLPQRGRTHA